MPDIPERFPTYNALYQAYDDERRRADRPDRYGTFDECSSCRGDSPYPRQLVVWRSTSSYRSGPDDYYIYYYCQSCAANHRDVVRIDVDTRDDEILIDGVPYFLASPFQPLRPLDIDKALLTKDNAVWSRYIGKRNRGILLRSTGIGGE